VLPHIVPALVASALIAFATSFSDLVAAFFLGGGGFNTLPVFIYSLIQFEPSPLINSLSSLIFLVGLLCILVALLSNGRGVVTIGEREPREL
jgi:ABC-type spermidine/putrescine transport system permease subunit II